MTRPTARGRTIQRPPVLRSLVVLALVLCSVLQMSQSAVAGGGVPACGGGLVGGTSVAPAPAVQTHPLATNGTAGSACGWVPASVPTSFATNLTSLWGVVWASPQVVVAVGIVGTVMRSVDAGETWNTVSTPVPPSQDFHALARDFGGALWAAGTATTVIRSVDLGATWYSVPASGLQGNVTSLSFPDAADPSFAYAVTSSGLFVSQNGGTSWSDVPTPAGSTVRTAAFYDAAHGWVEGGPSPGQVYYTSDGGAHWTTGNTQGVGTMSASMVAEGPGTAWLLGIKDTVLRTFDGTNWSSLALDSQQRSHALTSVDGQYGWVGSEDANLFYTWNGGACWVQEAVPAIPEIYAIGFENATWGVSVGDGVIWYTRDAGISPYDTPGVAGSDACTGVGVPAVTLPLLLVSSLAGLAAAVLMLGLARRGRSRGRGSKPRAEEEAPVARQRHRARYRSRKRYIGG